MCERGHGSGDPTTIFGRVYTSADDKELGIGSYHFISNSASYISYENEICKDCYPRLDGHRFGPGKRLPEKMAFQDASFDAASRTFRGWVSFSREGLFRDEVFTVDGIEREVYEMVFSPDLTCIIDGSCKFFQPNASKPSQIAIYGQDLRYQHWPRQVAVPSALPSMTQCRASVSERPRAKGAVDALMARDAKAMKYALESGADVDMCVQPARLWEKLGWNPSPAWCACPPHLPLLVAAILLQWPEGVQLCVQYGAYVNATYSGPIQKNECSTDVPSGTTPGTCSPKPLLRVALSVRGWCQCLVVRHILDRRVQLKTFQTVKKKAQDEMEVDTKILFQYWCGPYAAQAK